METPFTGIMPNFCAGRGGDTEFNVNPDPAACLQSSHDLTFFFMYAGLSSYIEEGDTTRRKLPGSKQSMSVRSRCLREEHEAEDAATEWK